MTAGTTHPFDAVAAGYDDAFTTRPLGRLLRERVWAELDAAFAPGDTVLELGCGTGEDAVHLAGRGVRVVATDASEAMLALARAKAAAAGVAGLVTCRRLDLGELTAATVAGLLPDRGPGMGDRGQGTGVFSGCFSDFGALNVLADRRPLAAALAACLRPGARVVLVVMGPLCLFEIAAFALRGRFATARRRLGGHATARLGGAPLAVYYPTAGRLRRDLAPHFRRLHAAPLGALLPPSELAGSVERWPRTFAALAAVERAAGRPLLALADHHLSVFARRGPS